MAFVSSGGCQFCIAPIAVEAVTAALKVDGMVVGLPVFLFALVAHFHPAPHAGVWIRTLFSAFVAERDFFFDCLFHNRCSLALITPSSLPLL
jgi:hypothetical protein